MSSLSPPFPPESTLYVDPFSPSKRASQEKVSTSTGTTTDLGSAQDNVTSTNTTASDDPPPFHLAWPALCGATTGLKRLYREDQQSISDFIASDLDVKRLNRFHKVLWLSGRRKEAHPLHYQHAIGRTIVPLEQCDLHLVWEGSELYIKPFPAYLLCYSAWRDYICHDSEVYGFAKGFLSSYLWLIRYPSDLRLAIELGLMPDSIDWKTWANFAHVLLNNTTTESSGNINKRYEFGELRMQPLDWLNLFSFNVHQMSFLFTLPVSAIEILMVGIWVNQIAFGIIGLGWSAPYWNRERSTYKRFLRSNMSLLISVAGFIALVLTAMQVGLATNELQNNISFQRASYGFTVFSIFFSVVTPLTILYIVVAAAIFSSVHRIPGWIKARVPPAKGGSRTKTARKAWTL